MLEHNNLEEFADPVNHDRADAGAYRRRLLARTALRYTFLQELAVLLHYNSFTILRRYGDWDKEPRTAASPSIISVCRRRA